MLFIELSKLEQMASELDKEAESAGVEIDSHTETLEQLKEEIQEQLSLLNKIDKTKSLDLLQR